MLTNACIPQLLPFAGMFSSLTNFETKEIIDLFNDLHYLTVYLLFNLSLSLGA